jgi:hypothetical protein
LILELSDAEYSGVLTSYEGLEGYEFLSPNKHIWVLWSPDENDTQIQLPDNVDVVLDKYGRDITPDGTEIIVNNPIYIELNP